MYTFCTYFLIYRTSVFGSKSIRKIHSAVERKAVLERYFESSRFCVHRENERSHGVYRTAGSAFERNFRVVANGQSQRRGQNMIEATGIRMHDTGYREQDKG
jgi:hypothetical protein